MPAADPGAFQRDALSLVPKRLVTRFKVIPWRLRGKTLFLGMVDPGDHEAVARIGYSLGYIVRPLVVPEFRMVRMVRMLREHFGVDERWRFTDTRGAEAVPPPAPVLKDPAEAAAAIVPVALRGRVVNLIWGDSGARADLGQLMAHTRKIPRAYLRIIRARVTEARKGEDSGPGRRKRPYSAPFTRARPEG